MLANSWSPTLKFKTHLIYDSFTLLLIDNEVMKLLHVILCLSYFYPFYDLNQLIDDIQAKVSHIYCFCKIQKLQKQKS